VTQGVGPEFKPQYLKKKKKLQVQGKTDKSVRIGGSCALHSVINRSNRQKVNKDIVDPNNTINKPDLILIFI
jgi:hypothetical protein